ncbi:hypothetical protein [Clostridium sp. KNHs214]|uniref:hypothetical protein n=1 Tax=Clostridium sp. KNHs214 TaxID=1540257 RepID=UPI0005559035|nr:hypothetical protein [Clostridium sp. KNHs214]
MKINYYEDKMIEGNGTLYSEKDHEIMNYLELYEIILVKNEELTKKILPNSYRNIFLSFAISYIIGVAIYYLNVL